MNKYEKIFETSQKKPEFIAQSAILDIIYQVEDILKNKQITKKKLAEIMNVSPAYITKIMKGDINISLLTIAKLASSLDCKFSAPKIFNITTEEDTYLSEDCNNSECNRSVEFRVNNVKIAWTDDYECIASNSNIERNTTNVKQYASC